MVERFAHGLQGERFPAFQLTLLLVKLPNLDWRLFLGTPFTQLGQLLTVKMARHGRERKTRWAS